MCNLYSITKGQQAIREAARAMRDNAGNMPSLPGVFADYSAPIVRNAPDGVRELTMARWGMPSPVLALKGRNSDPGVTNVRNVASPHWRRWLDVDSRCVVPFTSFSENEVLANGSRPPVWFALDESRPLAFFAGIWTRWTSVRKVKEGETTNEIFAFLTTEPNAVVKPIHVKAMPVILTAPFRLYRPDLLHSFLRRWRASAMARSPHVPHAKPRPRDRPRKRLRTTWLNLPLPKRERHASHRSPQNRTRGTNEPRERRE
jgi:putative SOS response-associated peptidase YedK